MTQFEWYVFFLCLIVFLLLTALSVVCLWVIIRLLLRLIRHGVEDENILEEYRKKQANEGKNKYGKIIDYAVSGVVCLVFVAMLIGAVTIRLTEDTCCGRLPTYRVVKTSSMSVKNEENTYLEKNGLSDQIQAFDLIRTEKLPDEMDLELYDIVVYETDEGLMIIHRIVEIEEPNKNHPDHRHFRLQGDAVDTPDRFPVEYEQMRAIYRGDRTPFIGSFILFMQSPAGWLCVLLIVVAMITTPLLEKVLGNARKERLLLLCPPEELFEGEEEEEEVLIGGSTDD